jgi:phosphate transport system substrate-binding protein
MKRCRSTAVLFVLVVVSMVAAGPVSVGLAASGSVTLKNADLVGAGATFPAPLYQRWIEEFAKQSPGFTIYYDAVGSGAGTKRFMAQEVDFGASDSAMSDEQIAQVESGVQLIPATAGIIVLAYHIPGVEGDLRLSREIYADIFMGRIAYWNDDRIRALNPHLELPYLNIVTITRSDSSGTTWAFTNHLDAISDQWREKGPGVGKKIDWPGNSMAARYNEGIATKLTYTWGSIGYLEYGIAQRAGLKMAAIENRRGHFILPDDTSGTTTLANSAAQMPDDLRLFMPDPDGMDSYPIVTYTWLLLYKSHPDPSKGEKVKRFVQWGLRDGQKLAAQYGYAPLPPPVATAAVNALQSVR